MRGLTLLSLVAGLAPTALAAAQAYNWKNVKIGGGGGFVPGIIFNPSQKGLAYVRTDIGGAYKLNSDDSWTPLLDFANDSTWNYWGVDALATDPVDPDRLYLVRLFRLCMTGSLILILGNRHVYEQLGPQQRSNLDLYESRPELHPFTPAIQSRRKHARSRHGRGNTDLYENMNNSDCSNIASCSGPPQQQHLVLRSTQWPWPLEEYQLRCYMDPSHQPS